MASPVAFETRRETTIPEKAFFKHVPEGISIHHSGSPLGRQKVRIPAGFLRSKEEERYCTRLKVGNAKKPVAVVKEVLEKTLAEHYIEGVNHADFHVIEQNGEVHVFYPKSISQENKRLVDLLFIKPVTASSGGAPKLSRFNRED